MIVHRSASDKLAVVHSSCLFGTESYSGQRERKSVWQGFQYKSKICELVSGKLSKCLYIHSYTHLITSSALNECLLVHNFQNNCSTECHCVTQKSVEVWLHNKCHKIYLSGPLGMFCLYVILTISYLRAQTIETSSLPTDSSQPLFKQIEIFSGILTVYFNCKYFPYYTRELLVRVAETIIARQNNWCCKEKAYNFCIIYET